MGEAGAILMVVGLIIAFVGAIMFLVTAFRASVLWGLGCLFVHPVSLIFLIIHWREAKKPFGIETLGLVLAVIGAMMGQG